MAIDQRRYYAIGTTVMDRAQQQHPYPRLTPADIAECRSITAARLIAAALNIYRPKVRRRKSAEKSK
jgi:hypothetical protein